VISIPSLPATPAVPAAPPQAPAASSSGDDPHSFANYLKSVQNRQSDDAASASTTPRLNATAKDKAGKDATSSGHDKKKSTLLTDTVPVTVTATAAAQDPKAFQLSWLHATGNNAKSGANSLPQQAATSGKELANEEDPSRATSDALTGKVAEAVSNAPVAFGATLSKQDVLRADGLKSGDTAKGGGAEAKPSEGTAKTSAAPSTAAKPVAEISKPSEGKNNQQHSGASSQDDQPAAGVAKAAAATAHADSAAPAIHTASTEASAQVSAAGSATVQNAYAPVSAAPAAKTADVAPTAAVTDPPATPTVRPQNIDLKIAGADNSQIDVRVSQRAGDVQVTVRTPDGDLAQSLRQHLPELSDRLSQAGVSSNLWQPQTAQASNSGGNDADSRYSDDAQTQQQNQQQQQSRHNNQNGSGRQQNTDTWLNELNQANNKESR
jgi:hypothetical protein